jgi:hypothetical protein
MYIDSHFEPHKAETLREILTDPNRLTISVAEAARILGIARTTAHYAYTHTGYLIEGVPVMTISTGSTRERRVVSTTHLRAALGIAMP